MNNWRHLFKKFNLIIKLFIKIYIYNKKNYSFCFKSKIVLKYFYIQTLLSIFNVQNGIFELSLKINCK
jgi:hypothetical protein